MLSFSLNLTLNLDSLSMPYKVWKLWSLLSSLISHEATLPSLNFNPIDISFSLNMGNSLQLQGLDTTFAHLRMPFLQMVLWLANLIFH